MRFGDRLLSSQHPPWSGSYVDYPRLKRLLGPLFDDGGGAWDDGSSSPLMHRDPDDAADALRPAGDPHFATGAASAREFRGELDREIEKALLFLLKSMGEVASDLADLSDRRRVASRNVKHLLHEEAILIGAEQRRTLARRQLEEIDDLRTEYLVRIGSKLLLLLHFVELNVEAIVKIVKKHDKFLSRWEESCPKDGDEPPHVRLRRDYLPRFAVRSPDPNVRCLFLTAADAGDCRGGGDAGGPEIPAAQSDGSGGRFGGWDALQRNLEVALRELHEWEGSLRDVLEPGSEHAEAEAAKASTPVASRSFSDFLLANGEGGPVGKLLSSSSSLLRLGSFKNADRSFFEPVIYQIRSSRMRLGQTHRRYLQMVYAHEMLHLVDEKDLRRREDEERLMRSRSEDFGSVGTLERTRKGSAGSEEEGRRGMATRGGRGPTVSGLSKFLNLASAGLYMCNYNIVAPTSGLYAELLGFDPANAGIIIGCTPAAVILSCVLYSWWSSYSYKRALLFASSCCMVGNIVYALALPCDSLGMVLIGRMLTGFGSARVINRRYIADYYSIEERTSGMADFVSASAFGMALGPALAASLGIVAAPGESDGDSFWTVETAPGYVMFVVWAAYLACNVAFFEEPERLGLSTVDPPTSRKARSAAGGSPAATEDTPLLKARNGEVGDVRRLHSLGRSYCNVPVLISLGLLVLLKSVIEGVSSSAPTLSGYYFDWGVHQSGIYLALLASFVLPTSFGVAYLSRRFDDRELILGALGAMFLGILGFLVYSEDGEEYSEARFIFFGMVVFVSSNSLEGPAMGLLSKTIPKSLARGILNAGLLATEAGTLGRVIGDFWLSSAAFMGLNEMLNRTFEPMCAMVGVSIVGTVWTWPHLQPRFDDEDDD